MHKRFPILGSSQDSDKMALRVKTTLLALIPLFVTFSGLLGYDIGQEMWQNLVEYIIDGITAVIALYAVVMHVWGWIRKLKK